MRNQFTQKLFRWYNLYQRNLPWIGSNDPYLVWLSEVILQQTRVEQGLAYFLKFQKKYPTVQHLAKSPSEEVLKMWEGLGYYSRARNMHSTAKSIVNELDGKFPDTFEGLIQLKGIGTYTAHAILSYAYKKPFAVVDGNVLRVLSRYFGIREPVDTPLGKAIIQQKANDLLDHKNAATFNQAMMDFGSLVCKPRQPDCPNCPFNKSCVAFSEDMTGSYPFKSKKTVKKNRYFHFLILRDGKKVLLEQRTGNDIWKSLFQFPLIETPKQANLSEIMQLPEYKALSIKKPFHIVESNVFKQQLTHQTLWCRFYIIDIGNFKQIQRKDSIQVSFKDFSDFTFPGVIRDFLKKNDYF